MPIYEYRCENGHTFEVMQRMSDPPVTKCEEHDAPVERVFNPIAVHFKGSGFYSTDYGSKKRARELKEAAGDGKASGDGHGSGEGKGSTASQDGGDGKGKSSKDDGGASGSSATKSDAKSDAKASPAKSGSGGSSSSAGSGSSSSG